MRRVAREGNSERWREVTREMWIEDVPQFSSTAGRQLPLWRLVLVADEDSPQWELLLLVHHIITDGVSGLALCESILDALSDDVDDNEASDVVLATRNDPLLEEVVDVRPELGTIVRLLAKV